ncbi:MAG: diaminopimelate epimerase [Flavobacteriales bacterium]
MHIPFHKYQGTGNDFIMLDNRQGNIHLTRPQVMLLCDRKFGIGSDGIILIEESDHADFYMNFYNPDGSQSFCGNGSRCAVRFAQHMNIVKSAGEFKAIDIKHDFESDENEVRIKMKNVAEVMCDADNYILHTGSPHYIIYVDDVNESELVSLAHRVRYSERFKEKGINVNLVHEENNVLHVRTYERGVENETLSCGTGVTAVALSYAHTHPEVHEVMVQTKGGLLKVIWQRPEDNSFQNIWLCGPAQFVYSGEIEI